MLSNLFAPLAMKVAGALILALTVALAFAMWRADVHHDRAERYAQTLAEMKAAQVVAERAAIAAKAKAEADYRDLAQRIDDNAEEARSGAMADAERWIAANRVRCEAVGRSASGPAPATGDNGASDRQGAGEAPELDEALVAVKADDVRICTANTLQAEAGREWALELEQQHRD